MSFSLDLGKTRSLGNLEQYDIIEFESQYVDKDIFMVQAIEKDDSIPAILLQLWQFEGGYNHAFKNVMENDLGINNQVPFFTPKKELAVVEEILNYRSEESGLSKKEELFFDVWPSETSENESDKFSVPYEVQIRFEDGSTDQLLLPDWTPIQKLPVDRITSGTEIEVWSINHIRNIMRVTKL